MSYRPRTFNETEQLKLRLETASLARMKAKLVQVRINVSDAEYECSAHGCLPFDRNKPPECNCWPPDAVAALANRQQENPDYSDAA